MNKRIIEIEVPIKEAITITLRLVPESQTRTKTTPVKADPLSDYPRLNIGYAWLLANLRKQHPKAKNSIKSKEALADLIRLDKYSEDEVMDTLVWLFTVDHKDANFWCRQVASFAPLRKRKDGLSKFDRIFEKYEWATCNEPPDKQSGGAVVEPRLPTEEDILLLEDE